MNKIELIELFRNVRHQTMKLVEPLEIEDYVVQTASYMSPPRWHIGHTTWFFEMLLKNYQDQYQTYSNDFLYFFNSYYEKFGMRIDKAKRGTRSRPTVRETVAYRYHIDEMMSLLIEKLDQHPKENELAPLIRLGLEHEMQHQELLVYDIKHLLCDIYDNQKADLPATKVSVSGMVEVPAGLYTLGYQGHDFAFDNEKPVHRIFLEGYAIDRAPVTNGEYLEFIKAGCYQDYQWWYSEAFNVITKEQWQAPLYWELQDGEWLIRDFRGLHSVADKAQEPVIHISYYEAAAFAKWAGKRLPTEAEWEIAACYDPIKKERNDFPWGKQPAFAGAGNFLEDNYWGVTPVGSMAQSVSPLGCHQMLGDMWEWTSSDYVPYPGFKSEFDEYTDKWMVNQKVLRGGSFATPRIHIRPTYRNYFYPQERWLINGFRCAKDL